MFKPMKPREWPSHQVLEEHETRVASAGATLSNAVLAG